MTAELTRHRPPRLAQARTVVLSDLSVPELSVPEQPVPEQPVPAQPVSPQPVPDRSDVHRLLDAIDDLVRRHRALARDGVGDDLHAELIAAELDQQVAVLRRLPRRPHP